MFCEPQTEIWLKASDLACDFRGEIYGEDGKKRKPSFNAVHVIAGYH